MAPPPEPEIVHVRIDAATADRARAWAIAWYGAKMPRSAGVAVALDRALPYLLTQLVRRQNGLPTDDDFPVGPGPDLPGGGGRLLPREGKADK